MSHFKYIVQQNSLAESIFLFPPWETHAQVAYLLGGKTVSAGFVQLSYDNSNLTVRTYGRSESLDMDSRSSDAELIKAFVQSG